MLILSIIDKLSIEKGVKKRLPKAIIIDKLDKNWVWSLKKGLLNLRPFCSFLGHLKRFFTLFSLDSQKLMPAGGKTG